MEKYIKITFSFLLACIISGCVTKNYENDKSTPVVQNESTNNDIAITRISLGLGYLNIGNTSQAKLNLEKAKRFAPKLVQVHTAFAHYYDTVGEPEQAISAYEKALSLSSNDADTLNNYGVFLCKQGRYQEAEKQILKAIAQPSYILVSQSYENLALCQLKADKFAKAELYFDKAILHSPSRASSLLHMVRLQYAKSDFKAAHLYLKRYEKATRRFSASALALAFKVFTKQHNNQTAKNYATMLVKMFPNSYEARQYLLNGLQEIEADQLAQKYQSSFTTKSLAKKSKKRTVKLSPNRTAKTETLAVIKPTGKKPTIDKSTIAKVAKAKPIINDSEELIEQKSSLAAPTTENKAIPPKKGNDQQQVVTLPVHVVEAGDSLFSISKKYNIHMKAIERWNGFSRGKVLKIGDVIYLANPKKIAKS